VLVGSFWMCQRVECHGITERTRPKLDRHDLRGRWRYIPYRMPVSRPVILSVVYQLHEPLQRTSTV
jgi:hypothetical protein